MAELVNLERWRDSAGKLHDTKRSAEVADLDAAREKAFDSHIEFLNSHFPPLDDKKRKRAESEFYSVRKICDATGEVLQAFDIDGDEGDHHSNRGAGPIVADKAFRKVEYGFGSKKVTRYYGEQTFQKKIVRILAKPEVAVVLMTFDYYEKYKVWIPGVVSDS